MADSTTPQTSTFNWASLLGPALGVGASLYGQNQDSNAINSALNAQTNAAGSAQTTLAPYYNAGTQALGKLTNGFDVTQQPGYQFGLQQGEQGINRGLAARGQYGSGGALKSLDQFNQNYADQQYGNEFNRQLSLAGMGQNAANAISGISQNLGNAAGAAQLKQGSSNQSTDQGIGSLLAQYLGGTNGQLAGTGQSGQPTNASSLLSALGGLGSSAASSINDLWNQYFGSSPSSSYVDYSGIQNPSTTSFGDSSFPIDFTSVGSMNPNSPLDFNASSY